MNMSKVYNFSSGPAMLPAEVLAKAQAELINYNGTGMSVMEMSHRSGAYKAIIEAADADFRKVMGIGDDYEVLFLQGGASLQFAMLPANLTVKGKAQFINSGYWTKKAIKEAKLYTNVDIIASTEDVNFAYVPDFSDAKFDGDYVYMTSNNTIYGTEFFSFPKTGDVPLVADMSSDIMSRPLNINDFGVIFAGAQKNIGPSGLTVVIMRKDLIKEPATALPTMMKYTTHAENGSMFNTPPTYGIYMAGLVFKWVLELGGLEAIEKINIEKAKTLYDFIDNSSFYKAPVREDSRSRMNVVFATPNADLDKAFASQAAKAGLTSLAGHRAVGGLRASIYNAMPIEGVNALIDFMKEFELANK